MIRDSVTDKSCAGWLGLLMAGSIAGSLLVVPVVQADETTSSGQGGQTPPSQDQSGWGSYPAPGAVPPPPGPYSSGTPGMPPQFRPDQDLEGAAVNYPPPMPPRFDDNPNYGAVTRDELLSQQEERRKQMDQYRQQREAEMQQRRDEMQAQHDAMRKQWEEDPCNKNMDQRSEERRKEWDERRAEQEKRWEQLKAEQDKRWNDARQSMPMPGMPGMPGAAAPQQQQPQQAAPASGQQQTAQQQTGQQQTGQQQTGQQQAPAYGYQPPGYGYQPPAPAPGYGYGYPPPPPGYGAPGWGYPGYPAPAAGGSTTSSQQGQ